MVPDRSGDTERFFAFWTEEEFMDTFGKHFTLIEKLNVTFKERMFLQAFFTKPPERQS